MQTEFFSPIITCVKLIWWHSNCVCVCCQVICLEFLSFPLYWTRRPVAINWCHPSSKTFFSPTKSKSPDLTGRHFYSFSLPKKAPWVHSTFAYTRTGTRPFSFNHRVDYCKYVRPLDEWRLVFEMKTNWQHVVALVGVAVVMEAVKVVTVAAGRHRFRCLGIKVQPVWRNWSLRLQMECKLERRFENGLTIQYTVCVTIWW